MSSFGRYLALAMCALPLAHGAVNELMCVPSAVPAIVHSEGLAEQMGDIVLNCTGTPLAAESANVFIFMTVPVTNHLTADNVTDINITLDTGSGPVSAGAAALLSGANNVTFPLNVQVPASGHFLLRISNLRGAPAVQGIDNTDEIRVTMASNGTKIFASVAFLTVGVPQRSLLASFNATTINCYGSPAPATISMSGLFAAGTRVFSTRITSGWVGAFQKNQPGADNGVRVVVSYTGFPAGARLFVPDVIAGYDATQATRGGDLSTPSTGGAYTPGGRGSLLLSRVAGTDANGAGGTLLYTPGGPGTVTFDHAGELAINGGNAIAVYEVVDSNPSIPESAEIPTFLAFSVKGDNSTPQAAKESVTLGPVSTVANASATDPVVRFVAAAPPKDCGLLGDCALFPKLEISAPALEFTSPSGGHIRGDYVGVGNSGGGTLAWTAFVTYQDGAGWVKLRFTPVLSYSWGAVQVVVSPMGLAPGTYNATLTIDAGAQAGIRELPIKFVVTDAVPIVQPARIDAVVNAASFAPGPLVPGSLAALTGAHLAGKAVAVTFDGLPARLLYTSDTQINLQVPPDLGVRPSAQAMVTVDGRPSAPREVSLAPIAPGIFPTGVLNLDYSTNSATNPVAAGSYLVLYATGLGGSITARLGDRDLAPAYGGPAPGLLGVQQVNLQVPADAGPMTTDLVVCGAIEAGLRACSPPVKVTVR